MVVSRLLDGFLDVPHGGDVGAEGQVDEPGSSGHGGSTEVQVVAPAPAVHGDDGEPCVDVHGLYSFRAPYKGSSLVERGCVLI